MLRPLRLILIVGVLLALLIACTEQETPTVSPSATPAPSTSVMPAETDDVFIVWGLSGVTGDDYVLETFQARHPDIEVTIVDQGWDEALRQSLQNAILMGRPPDVVIGENYFRAFAAEGAMQPLDDVLAPHLDDIIPATYAGAVYQGSVYAVPFLTGIFAFERNCSVIEAAGLDCDNPPEYWDELIADARAISEAGAGEYYGYSLQGPGGTAVGSAFRIAVYQAQLDALPCADDACTIPNFNDAAAIPVYEMLREIVQYTPPGLIDNTNEGEVYEALFRGISAFQMAGSWHVGWAESAGCDTCRYSAIPTPRDGHTANLLVGNVLFGAPTNSRYPELAKEWLELIISSENQGRIYEEIGRLPVRRSALAEIQPSVDDATAVFIEELLTNDSIQTLPQWENNPRETWAIYNNLLTDVLKTDRPIPEIMAEAQAAVEALD